MTEPIVDDEAWRRQRANKFGARNKTDNPPTVQIPNNHPGEGLQSILGEFDVEVETIIRIRTRDQIIVEEHSCCPIRQALSPAGRGPFLGALDQAFQATARNVKISFSRQIAEPETVETPVGSKSVFAAGNDRRSLNPNDVADIVSPPLAPPQPDDFPDQLPSKPIVPKVPS